MTQRNCAMPKLHLAVSRLYLKNIQLTGLSIWEDQMALKYTILLLHSYQKHFERKQTFNKSTFEPKHHP